MYHQKPLIGVKGRVQIRVYEKDEVKKFATEVVADEAYFTGSKAEAGAAPGGSFPTPGPVSQPQTTAPAADDFSAMGFSEIDAADDELPF